MRLADRIAQCRTPFVVENTKDGSITHLNNAAAFSKDIESCATRYVLSDELTRLCTALAYSKGASTLACADLLHVPAERVWVEWTEAPWRNELARYGFKSPADSACSGRRGVFIQSTPQGRQGLMRTFWASGESELEVLSSSMEAYFDFDTQEGDDPAVFDRQKRPSICVSDNACRESRYLAALLSIPVRALLAGLLRQGTVDGGIKPQLSLITHSALLRSTSPWYWHFSYFLLPVQACRVGRLC